MATKVQDLQLQDHDLVDKLNELEAVEKPDKSAIEAVEGERREVREKLREAMKAEADEQTTETDTVDREVRERLELRGRSRFGTFLNAVLRGHVLRGPEAEYAAAFGASDRQIPIDLFEQDRAAGDARRREVRADTATPAPATGTGATLAPVQPYIFSESIAPALGIDMPSVPSGSYSEATITTPSVAAAKAKEAAVESTAGVLTPVTANPRGITARLTLTYEDLALIGQSNFESALRSNTGMALSNELDEQIVSGDGSSPNINGLLNQLTKASAADSSKADFDALLGKLVAQIDGLWSMTLRDVATVVPPTLYRLSAQSFRDKVVDTGQRGAASLGETSFSDYAAMKAGGWRTASRMPVTKTSGTFDKHDQAIHYLRGRPGLRTACVPHWGMISVDDIYSTAGSRSKHFTLSVLIGDKVLIVQPAAYKHSYVKVAA